MKMNKLKRGDTVAVLSPSSAAPGVWPHVHELGLSRLREIFELVPLEFKATRKVGSTKEERAKDLIAAFENPEVKAVIASIGGDDQVTYINQLPSEPFVQNPKPFFGFSDNSHFCNFLFQNNIPSYYGGSVLTQYAMQGEMDPYTIAYLKHALFEEGEFELTPSETYNDVGLSWSDETLLSTKREHFKNEGWYWDGEHNAEGILWGGCIESIDEMLRHGVIIPSLEEFENIVLMLESSEELPSSDYVFRFLRALGERGIIKRIKAVVVGRPKAWEFNIPNTPEEREEYRKSQREIILETVRAYNPSIPVIQNLNFGHTDPQIPMPYGNQIRIDSKEKRIFANF